MISETWGTEEVRLGVCWSKGRGAWEGLVSLSEMREHSWTPKQWWFTWQSAKERGTAWRETDRFAEGSPGSPNRVLSLFSLVRLEKP